MVLETRRGEHALKTHHERCTLRDTGTLVHEWIFLAGSCNSFNVSVVSSPGEATTRNKSNIITDCGRLLLLVLLVMVVSVVCW